MHICPSFGHFVQIGIELTSSQFFMYSIPENLGIQITHCDNLIAQLVRGTSYHAIDMGSINTPLSHCIKKNYRYLNTGACIITKDVQ